MTVSTSAFHGRPELKLGLLDHIDALIDQGHITGKRNAKSLMALMSTEWEEFSAVYGLPPSLVLLLDVMPAYAGNADAITAWRDLVVAVEPGADLNPSLHGFLLMMLAPPRDDIDPSDITGRLSKLHQRLLTGEVVARAEWASLRNELVGLSEEKFPPGDRRKLQYSVWEAAAWPMSSSPSILVQMFRSWGILSELVPDPEWSDADEARKDQVLSQIWQEQAPARTVGEQPNYPALFSAREPDLAGRFVAHLDRANAGASARWIEAVRYLAMLFRGQIAANPA
ncbi:hypothetical protein [Nitrospirillum pindoramense]|uniref:Uncharacterized protein n=1 Tax=Nitrospirillum amazonense TaxID=28077 RepID=A0A560HC49_9PROT|nr:hypothetical protein [Nitrospirillum amazonense]TWB43942.1 hypothetical protein FBZ90_104330 [Nitrospirillum amazonense]